MIKEILANVAEFKARTKALKDESLYYPIIITKEYPDNLSGGTEMKVSTLVRVQDKDGVWYKVHCVETFYSDMSTGNNAIVDMMKRFAITCHMTQHCYIPTPEMDDVDEIQVSERQRLIDSHPKL